MGLDEICGSLTGHQRGSGALLGKGVEGEC